MCIKAKQSDHCIESTSSPNVFHGCIPDDSSAELVRRDEDECESGFTPTYEFPTLTFGGMIVHPDDDKKHENFYFGVGETKYDTAHEPLKYEKDSLVTNIDLYGMKISHPLIRDYPQDAPVYIWESEQSWVPDRKELHADITAGENKIKIVKEADDTNAPRVGDTIALHSKDNYANHTITKVTEVASANGNGPHWEVELNTTVANDFDDESTHVKLHETSPERDEEDEDSGLSDAALGGIIGGSIGGVILLALVAKEMMPGGRLSTVARYRYLDAV